MRMMHWRNGRNPHCLSGMATRRLSVSRSSSTSVFSSSKEIHRYPCRIDTSPLLLRSESLHDARGSRRLVRHSLQQQQRWHGGGGGGPTSGTAATIKLTFLQPNGETKITVPAFVGESFLQVAHRHEIDLEGACEGVCACSTCHLILPHTIYDRVPPPSEDEEDMLDMAFGLTETSRLGCQVLVTADMDEMVLEMPKATRNFYVDGHKPKPH